jgi:hypothetical protein
MTMRLELEVEAPMTVLADLQQLQQLHRQLGLTLGGIEISNHPGALVSEVAAPRSGLVSLIRANLGRWNRHLRSVFSWWGWLRRRPGLIEQPLSRAAMLVNRVIQDDPERVGASEADGRLLIFEPSVLAPDLDKDWQLVLSHAVRETGCGHRQMLRVITAARRQGESIRARGATVVLDLTTVTTALMGRMRTRMQETRPLPRRLKKRRRVDVRCAYRETVIGMRILHAAATNATLERQLFLAGLLAIANAWDRTGPSEPPSRWALLGDIEAYTGENMR